MPRRPTARLAREIRAYLSGRALPGSRSRTARLAQPWPGSRIQTLLFDAGRWTPAAARSWARSHGFRSGDVHATARYVRLRQVDPTRGRPKRQIELGRGRGIYAVVEATAR